MSGINTDYLIIGNSAAGISAAERIRQNDPNATISIVSKEEHPAYGRPLISYMIEGKTSKDGIWLKPEGFYEVNKLSTYLGPEFEVVELVPDKHQARLANSEEINYGKCLLATGSNPFVPPIKGLSDKENVFTFMSLDDANALWSKAKEVQESAKENGKPTRAVVIGAGLIGLKAAEAISSYVDEVLVLELAPRILPTILDEECASLVQAGLLEHGIKCMPGVTMEELLGNGKEANRAILTNGDRVDLDYVVAAVGVRPNSALAVNAGAEEGRGLVCDRHLRTTLEDVYAAGDIVQVNDLLDGSQHPLALWPNAVAQGAIVADHMTSSPEAEPYDGSFAVNAVDFFEASLLTSGIINPPEDNSYVVKTQSDGSSYAKFVIKDDRLVGYILLNRPEKAGIYTSIIENELPVSSFDESMFSEEPENLKFDDAKRWERMHKGYPSHLNQLGWEEVA